MSGLGLLPIKREGWGFCTGYNIAWNAHTKEFREYMREKSAWYYRFFPSLCNKIARDAWGYALFINALKKSKGEDGNV